MERGEFRQYMERQIRHIRKYQKHLVKRQKRMITFEEAVKEWIQVGLAEKFRKSERKIDM